MAERQHQRRCTKSLKEPREPDQPAARSFGGGIREHRP